MLRSRSIWGAVVLCLGALAPLRAQTPDAARAPKTFDAALAEAKQRGTPVLLEFYTEW